MKFNRVLEEVKPGHKALATSVGGSATPKKVDNYLSKLDKEGVSDKIDKEIRKKGLTGKRADAYKWGTMRKIMKGHFN